MGGNTIEKLVVQHKWVCFWKNILTGSANGEPNRIQNKSRYFIKTMGWENVTNSFSAGELGLGFQCDEIYLRCCCHILLLTLSEFKRINYLLFPPKIIRKPMVFWWFQREQKLIDFKGSRSMEWFLYDNGLRHERVNIRSKT